MASQVLEPARVREFLRILHDGKEGCYDGCPEVDANPKVLPKDCPLCHNDLVSCNSCYAVACGQPFTVDGGSGDYCPGVEVHSVCGFQHCTAVDFCIWLCEKCADGVMKVCEFCDPERHGPQSSCNKHRRKCIGRPRRESDPPRPMYVGERQQQPLETLHWENIMPCSLCEAEDDSEDEGQPQSRQCSNTKCWSYEGGSDDENTRVVCLECSPERGKGEGENWLCDICSAPVEIVEEREKKRRKIE